MKYLKLYSHMNENFDWNDDDFDEEEFDTSEKNYNMSHFPKL